MFAYGQTGSGKTHTVMGIIEMLAEDIFTKKEGHTRLHLTFTQLLGNTMTDLLAEEGEETVSVMEDKFGKINMVGAREAKSREEGRDDSVENQGIGRS